MTGSNDRGDIVDRNISAIGQGGGGRQLSTVTYAGVDLHGDPLLATANVCRGACRHLEPRPADRLTSGRTVALIYHAESRWQREAEGSVGEICRGFIVIAQHVAELVTGDGTLWRINDQAQCATFCLRRTYCVGPPAIAETKTAPGARSLIKAAFIF